MSTQGQVRHHFPWTSRDAFIQSLPFLKRRREILLSHRFHRCPLAVEDIQ
jgi:hypothetical protein